MSNLDFEKTQLWAKGLVNAPIPAAPSVTPRADSPAQVSPKKPVMKTMSKEEKIILATGGALAVGLGAIVISSLSDDQTDKIPAPVTDLTAPTLDLGTPPEPVAEIHENNPPPASKPRHAPPREHAEKRDTPAHISQPSAPEEHHALLEIPEIPEVATGVDDRLTFIEAFNTARAEVGPAGLFAWRDTYYSTFTDKEWESVPEDKKAMWLDGAEPIIDPGYENLSEGIPAVELPSHVIVAERGAITWTGIDKNGDGNAEILMARINGQSPMVLMDTDKDGILDMRYDFEAKSGKTFASEIEPFAMSTADIEHLDYVPVEKNMGFYNNALNDQISGKLPVSIVEENGQYYVNLDIDMDQKVDAVTYLSDDRGPVVGLDDDNDGRIETGYVYDSEKQTVSSLAMEPMEEMSLGEAADEKFTYVEDDAYMGAFELETESELAVLDDDDSESDSVDLYFDKDQNDDYVNS